MAKLSPDEVAELVTLNIGMSLGKVIPLISKYPATDKSAGAITAEKLLSLSHEIETEGFPLAAFFVQAVVDGLDTWLKDDPGFGPKPH